ncbi:unnamed protein product [Protopolystoma xenopodis]|uniref:Uncharacterized protein n=1 Tax=Protopolystoma xenopodis TaxID=117903 RepID=A0A448X263_9PLAT|nr:unnamed protein product [Protopolystoma xenopodis]
MSHLISSRLVSSRLVPFRLASPRLTSLHMASNLITPVEKCLLVVGVRGLVCGLDSRAVPSFKPWPHSPHSPHDHLPHFPALTTANCHLVRPRVRAPMDRKPGSFRQFDGHSTWPFCPFRQWNSSRTFEAVAHTRRHVDKWVKRRVYRSHPASSTNGQFSLTEHREAMLWYTLSAWYRNLSTGFPFVWEMWLTDWYNLQCLRGRTSDFDPNSAQLIFACPLIYPVLSLSLTQFHTSLLNSQQTHTCIHEYMHNLTTEGTNFSLHPVAILRCPNDGRPSACGQALEAAQKDWPAGGWVVRPGRRATWAGQHRGLRCNRLDEGKRGKSHIRFTFAVHSIGGGARVTRSLPLVYHSGSEAASVGPTYQVVAISQHNSETEIRTNAKTQTMLLGRAEVPENKTIEELAPLHAQSISAFP